MKKLFLILLAVCPAMLFGQNITGHVYEESDSEKNPISGVNVYWVNTTEGTATDAEGYFELRRPSKSYKQLVISYIGFEKDTVSIEKKQKDIEIFLRINKELKEVKIVSRGSAAHIDRMSSRSVQEITGAELCKAACCNLGESFETNASVDVSYSDAVTGAKQIQLLGLSGIYTQMMVDNVPDLYGLAQPFGLSYLPGTWMKAIQISKGCSSVVDGYTAVAGQINTNTKDPDDEEKIALNGMFNSMMAYEGNFVGRVKFNKHLSTNLMLHAGNMQMKHDANGDGFLDMPMMSTINIRNKWKNRIDAVSMLQMALNALYENRAGGQMAYYENAYNGDFYGINIVTKRFEALLKGGHEFNDDFNIAFKSSGAYHNQTSFYGKNTYDAVEKTFYFNTVFQGIFGGDEAHSFSTGLSYYYDDYVENIHINKVDGAEAPVIGNVLNDTVLTMTESVPGAYFEYTFHKENLPIVIVGIRGDYHNNFGFFVTPRFHVRYTLNEHNVFRASVGKGYRTAHILSENSSLLASSKQLVIIDNLKMEEAWNYGVNYTRYFDINEKELTLNLSAYRTHFKNQVIVDMDNDYRYVYFYNLPGRSFSNVFQIEGNYELFKGLDVVLAFRYQDVKVAEYVGDITERNSVLERKPMVNRFKGLLNLSYGTRLNKWRFDYTLQVNGDQRLPVPDYADEHPEIYVFEDSAPVYCIMNAQVTKNFRRWSIYLGGENLTNYKQNNPIVCADNPFSEFFDSSRVWGPISGIKVYLGFRYTLD